MILSSGLWTTVRNVMRAGKRSIRGILERFDLGQFFLAKYHIHGLQKIVRAEARRLEAAVKWGPPPTVRIIYDNRVSPPTYGDLYNVIMLARLLALRGSEINFILVDDKRRRTDWSKLNQTQQSEFVREQSELARFLLPPHVSVQRVNPHDTLQDLPEGGESFTLFATRVGGQEPIYQLVPLLLRALSTKHLRSLPDEFLLSQEQLGDSAPNTQHLTPYIAWHVRRGLWSEERDSDDTTIESDFRQLRELFPHHKIMILSSPIGIAHAMNVLSRSGHLDCEDSPSTRVFGQPENGFINAIPWVLGADFYFQRRGGGAGQIAIFSGVPYLYISNDRISALLLGKIRKRIVPWARSDQVFSLKANKSITI